MMIINPFRFGGGGGGGGDTTFFLAQAGAEQSVSDGPAATVIDYGTEVFDPSNVFASNVFTVPAAVDGFYAILTASVKFKTELGNTNSHSLRIQLSTDGGTNWTTIVSQGSRTTLYHKAFTTVVMNEGDKYRVQFNAIDGTGRIADDVAVTYFGGIIMEPVA